MLKVYQCAKCKKVILSKEELKLEGWVELVAGSTDAAQEKHIPVWTQEGNKVSVTVGSTLHPMTPEHYIQWICLQTKEGNQRKELAPNTDPKACFMLCDGDEVEAVYAYCNLHGFWKG